MENTSKDVEATKGYKTPRLSMNEKLTFGLGDFGANFSWTFMSSFVTIYLTDTVGLPAGIIGTVILISQLTDGFSDLFMGSLIDNTNTKMGKAKPWIFWTAPILGILVFMLFNVPDAANQTIQLGYVFLIYLAISAVFYTANNVAYSSLTTLMTNNEKDRVSLGSMRFIFANAAVFIITTFTTFIVSFFGGGQQGWSGTAALYGILCAIPLMLTGWFVKERNVAKVSGVEQSKDATKERIPLKTTVKVLFSNKYFLLALVLYILWYLRQTGNAMRVYYATYVFGNADFIAIMSAAALLPMVIGLMLAPKIAGKFGVKKSSTIGLSISAIAYLFMTIFSENLTLFTIGMVINAIGLVPLQAALTAIVADVGDIVYWKTGVPVQGSVFSLTSAGMKIGQGITASLVAWSLSLGNYIAQSNAQPDSSIFAMKSMQIYFPLLIVILMLIIILVMNYEKHMPEITKDIQNNRVGENRSKNELTD